MSIFFIINFRDSYSDAINDNSTKSIVQSLINDDRFWMNRIIKRYYYDASIDIFNKSFWVDRIKWSKT